MMRRPDDSWTPVLRPHAHPHSERGGYTLVEILTATVLMLIIMMAVTIIFANVTDTIGRSRATLEMSQRLRTTSALLKQDLENVTAMMTPPLHPDSKPGYFELIEGPIGPVVDPWDVALDSDRGMPDSTVGDLDDIIMFTAKTDGEPYVGLVNDQTTVSDTAEIIWFLRGTTLYRRVLLVKPDAPIVNPAGGGFYATNDLSVHKDWEPGLSAGQAIGTPVLKANSLADLTRPEWRFGHYPDPRFWTTPNATARFAPHPFFYQPWLGFPNAAGTAWVPGLNMPVLSETAHTDWDAGRGLPVAPRPNGRVPLLTQSVDLPASVTKYDAWTNPYPWSHVDPLKGTMTGYDGPRFGEDVVLTNVVSFDVKVWDPTAPILTAAAGTEFLFPGDPAYIARLGDSTVGVLSDIRGTPPAGFPAVGAYVDLNYMVRIPYTAGAYPDASVDYGTGGVLLPPKFHRQGSLRSRVYGTLPGASASDYYPSIYDTWSLHYEYNQRTIAFVPGVPTDVGDENGNGIADEGSNGLDDESFDESLSPPNVYCVGVVNGVDDAGERETQPPYATPLQGIQVKIRVFEPGSRQVREVTVIQKFRTR